MNKRDYLKKAKDEFVELAKQMQEDGIIDRYEIRPYFKEEPDIETIKEDKYINREDRMDYHEWCRIKIYGIKEIDKFHEMRNNLLKKWKVAFDMGGSSGYVDWEIDWSFRTSANDEDITNYFNGVNIVDAMIDKFNRRIYNIDRYKEI